MTISGTPEQLAMHDASQQLDRWPADFNPTIAKHRFVRIGETHGVSQFIRGRSWAVLADVYIIDQLGIRDTKGNGKVFGGTDAAELVGELGITEVRESGLVFKTSPYNAETPPALCFPDELDDLDIRSFYDYARRVIAVTEQGQDEQQQSLLRRWIAGNKSGPKIAEHWGRAARFLVRQETAKLPS